jgi:hypothetical protein
MHNQSGGSLLCLLHAQSIRWLLSILATHLLRMCLCCLPSSAHIAGSPTPGVCVAVHDSMIRTTTNMIRCLLFQASLPATYWAEALHTATHLLNRLPSKAVSHPTPHFALYGTAPSYDHLRVFGCACYPNISATAPNKLSPRNTRCLFLGYSPDHKGYRCLDLTSHRIIISRHVVFDEDVFPLAGSTPPTDLDSLLESDPVPLQPRRPVLRRYLLLVQPRRHSSRPFPRHARPRRPRLRHARPRRSCLRHARPRRSCLRHARARRSCLRHARPRRPRLRHTRPRRPRLASPTPRSSTTAAAKPLPPRPPTRARRRARPASPTPPSSITAASRPHPPLSTFRRSAPSRPYTTRSPSTATPDTSTRW